MTRQDGRVAFSVGGRRLAETRYKADKGRIQRILGSGGPFSESFKKAVLADYDQILERTHLEDELMGAKKVLNALNLDRQRSENVDLLNRLNADPCHRKEDCILCPIWRHSNAMDMTAAAVSRYLFPEKIEEVYLLTIVFDFAANLYELEEKVLQAQANLKSIISRMSRRRRGIMMVGALEPDLRSSDDLSAPRSDLSKFMAELNRDVPFTGGWVLSGHFIVRVPHKDDLRSIIKDNYPSKRWARVQFEQIYNNKTLAAHMMYILGYAAKYPKPLFEVPIRGSERAKANKKTKRIASTFLGPSFDDLSCDKSFDVSSAIRQWALFVDRMGTKNMLLSVENVHAQKWFSQSEWHYIRKTDLDMAPNGMNLIELLRDRELTGGNKTKDSLLGKMRPLRTRSLQYDAEWLETTDLQDVDPFTQPVNLDEWLYKKK